MFHKRQKAIVIVYMYMHLSVNRQAGHQVVEYTSILVYIYVHMTRVLSLIGDM